MASFAGLCESARHVIRITGALEILQVTGYARRAREVVIIIDVAISALPRRYRMRTC